ncbi:MAG: DUF1566 domain-containing protein [Spirochaetia bacterium]|nr:DUF1566 domain-containing protein [Spirochaetia bacterium]
MKQFEQEVFDRQNFVKNNYLKLKEQELGGFSGDNYWSSSEYFASLAWDQDFLNGSQNLNNRSPVFRVRPVRAF